MEKRVKRTKEVFIVSDYGTEYRQMFEKAGWSITDRIEHADLIQFVGGEDVTPSFYGQHPHHSTRSNLKRDLYEQTVFLASLKLKKPMAGICRGGQFLNVMNGGQLWQDVDGHCGRHEALSTDLKASHKIAVTSTHHQMMILPNPRTNLMVLMTANCCSKRTKMNSLKSKKPSAIIVGDAPKDIEAVYFTETNCLCFQPHPEFEKEDALKKLYFLYVETLLMR
jgi:gamma-glutamyl-gamma-aminobutyrate hydrolase PuuD